LRIRHGLRYMAQLLGNCLDVQVVRVFQPSRSGKWPSIQKGIMDTGFRDAEECKREGYKFHIINCLLNGE
jgi:hypothetical protein